MATAAASSIIARCSRARFPPARKRCDAVTVLNRSSTNRTGTPIARASRPARSRAFAAAGPSPPPNDLGNPTMTSIG